MSKTHNLKTWPVYFAALHDGTKTFELRRDDRGYEVGDTLRLREWDVDTEYSGEEVTRTVTYILRNMDSVPTGFCIMALAPIGQPEWAQLFAMLRSERDAALAAKEAAEEDGKLLDWLEEHGVVELVSFSLSRRDESDEWSIREAIRNAMKGEA